MYVEHPDRNLFKLENSTNSKIWRYMDFWKFLNLLKTSSLYFSSTKNMGDEYEGKFHPFIKQYLLEQDEKNGNKLYEMILSNLDDFSNNQIISSWNYSSKESFSMWKMYAKDKFGIAIQTNLENLIKCFKDEKRTIYIGEVQYFNELNKILDINLTNFYVPILTKLDYYSFENEIRCITENGDSLIKVDLNILIKNIYISPYANNDFVKLLNLLKEEYNLNFNINKSGIRDKWL